MGTKSEQAAGRPRSEVNHAIAELLAKNDNVILPQELRELGVSRRATDRRVASGVLYRAGFDAYSASPSRLTSRGQRRAALRGIPGRALSSVTAAAQMDLDRIRRGDGIHVIQLGAGRWPQPDVTIHRTKVLPPEDVAEIDGMPCTSASRTLLDCAATVELERLHDLVDRAVELRLYDGLGLERVMQQRPNARGIGRLRVALAQLDETAGRHRSAFERRTTALIRESTLIPTPVVNAPLVRFRPDVGWVGTRALVECDGRDYHRSPAQILADEAREVALLAAGFVILRLRWHQVVYEPRQTLRRLEAFYLANQAPPIPGVAGRIAF